ncbi:spermatogenesis-associated protein 19, mitochondrial isoform X2 [Camelus ferus]|uniref:Spermatogenesis-associated protein 19, mitochondrial isoform X2 n=2 Tax=Camelus TaxID=9836 RepID=A0A8B8SDQ7_CAMFR|nr:spermatogenesis-associated protein 19, mitochondrial isoform X2 [Camelus ferus]XP_045369239.1 spermatogenesis-associated protein 19, mitochondrial isoform X2 [Camelus bactrianus]
MFTAALNASNWMQHRSPSVTEEEASKDIKEKMSASCPPSHGQDVHVTRDVVKHHLSKSDLLKSQSQEVLEERTRIQFIRWRRVVVGLHWAPPGCDGAPWSPVAPLQLCCLLWRKIHLSKMCFCFRIHSHTRIFQVPSEVRNDVMRDRIEQVRRSLCHLSDETSQELHDRNSCSDC